MFKPSCFINQVIQTFFDYSTILKGQKSKLPNAVKFNKDSKMELLSFKVKLKMLQRYQPLISYFTFISLHVSTLRQGPLQVILHFKLIKVSVLTATFFYFFKCFVCIINLNYQLLVVLILWVYSISMCPVSPNQIGEGRERQNLNIKTNSSLKVENVTVHCHQKSQIIWMIPS
jgi:hypothetical protein